MNGELRGRDFRLVDGKNVMGTAADCDVVLTDPYLSSKHAVIRHENGVFTLVDLDSTNGTYLNERRVSKEDLIDNDKVRLGRSEMKFKSVE
jgi:pSer/pThr/pTyr-binding forkhead associated (FHA) protein